LVEWWAAAEKLRAGGWDRVLVAADYSPSIAELNANGVNGELYMHEIYDVNPGESRAMLDLIAEVAVPAYQPHGARLVGSFRTALVDDRECIVLWALPDWAAWARFETAIDADPDLRSWRERARRHVRRTHRCLMVDAPLSPLRTGRQPQVSDRVPFD
jgi:NIPSNAP